jgi:hypothetical protein
MGHLVIDEHDSTGPELPRFLTAPTNSASGAYAFTDIVRQIVAV